MELFKNADITLSVSIHSAQYYKLIQDGRQVFHSLVTKLPVFKQSYLRWHQFFISQAHNSKLLGLRVII